MTKQKLFLTFFGSGLSPYAPGTVGTLASIPLGLIIYYTLGNISFLLITLILTFISIKETDKYELKTGLHDQQHIVIDETIGIWLTMSISFFSLNFIEFNNSILFITIFSFIMFRLLDIIKPLYIGHIDREWSGGLGVVMDDFLAGFIAGFFIYIQLLFFIK